MRNQLNFKSGIFEDLPKIDANFASECKDLKKGQNLEAVRRYQNNFGLRWRKADHGTRMWGANAPAEQAESGLDHKPASAASKAKTIRDGPSHLHQSEFCVLHLTPSRHRPYRLAAQRAASSAAIGTAGNQQFQDSFPKRLQGVRPDGG